MLKIRLARVGKKKRPTYRFIVSESARDTYGKALEILGHYNPFSKVTEVNKERILYWVSKGAKASPTAHNLLIDQNVLSGEKVKASKAKKSASSGEAAADEEKKSEATPSAQGVEKTEPKAAQATKPDEKKEKVTEEKSAQSVATKEEVKVQEPAAQEKKEVEEPSA